MTNTHYAETTYGFQWGPLEVSRLISDPKGGYLLEVTTPHRSMEIRVSPSGRLIQSFLKGPKPRKPSTPQKGA